MLDDEDEPNLCEFFQREATKMRLINTENASCGCKNLKPLDRTKILCGLSQADLQSRMGPRYSEISQQCFQLRKGMGTFRT